MNRLNRLLGRLLIRWWRWRYREELAAFRERLKKRD